MHPVLFVSLGPGEPELITVKGLKALQAADCIFCPQTRTRSGTITSRAADILRQLAIPEATQHRFTLPMSKQREQALAVYDQVYGQARSLCLDGKRVCIVAEGDAGFYSSIHYVMDRLLAEDLPAAHIAGIPAFIAAGASGRIPITRQEERLVVIPGTVSAEEIARLADTGHTVVIMKLSQCTGEVQRCLRLHPEYSYHYFENVGTPNERHLQGADRLTGIPFPYFSLLIIRSCQED